MASAFTHAFTGVALTRIASGAKRPWLVYLGLAGSAVLPDADVIGFRFGVRYGDLLGHRGLTHSLTFALVWAVLAVSIFCRKSKLGSAGWWRLVVLFFVVTASHGVLDALTNGGLGVAFFSPFVTTRYFFPWRPIVVSPISIARFFTARSLAVIVSELLVVWFPLGFAWSLASLVRRLVARRAKGPS